jgi:hypothetical protein
MAAGGVAADIKAITIAVESVRIFVNPGDPATDLFGHNAQVTAGLFDCDEIERNKMCARIHEHFGWKGIIFCLSAKPSPTMDEYEDRHLRAFRPIDIQFLDCGRAIRFAHRLPDPSTCGFAAGCPTTDILHSERRVKGLIVGRI